MVHHCKMLIFHEKMTFSSFFDQLSRFLQIWREISPNFLTPTVKVSLTRHLLTIFLTGLTNGFNQKWNKGWGLGFGWGNWIRKGVSWDKFSKKSQIFLYGKLKDFDCGWWIEGYNGMKWTSPSLLICCHNKFCLNNFKLPEWEYRFWFLFCKCPDCCWEIWTDEDWRGEGRLQTKVEKETTNWEPRQCLRLQREVPFENSWNISIK